MLNVLVHSHMLYANILVWLVWWASWLIVGINAKRNRIREPFLSRLPHLLLLMAGFGLVFHTVAIPDLLPIGVKLPITGMIITIIGLSIAWWARIHLGRNWSGLVVIKEDHELIATGPYSVVRHPIYLGLIIAMIGSAITTDSVGAAAGVASVTAAYIIKLMHEEQMLSAKFPESYKILCMRVPYRLFPPLY